MVVIRRRAIIVQRPFFEALLDLLTRGSRW
jgi:hypothetical protein